MFEDIIVQLDQMGVQYTEDYDIGSLTVDVGALDKVALIGVIQAANDSGLEFTVDEASLVIMAGAEPIEEFDTEEEAGPGLEDIQAGALDQMF